MAFLGRLIVSTLAVLVTAFILPGVTVDGVLYALLVAAVLSLLNAVVKPVLVLLTIPITIVTLGFFLLIINAVLIWLTAKLVSGFHIDGFLTAFFFSLVLSVVNAIFNSLNTPKEEE